MERPYKGGDEELNVKINTPNPRMKLPRGYQFMSEAEICRCLGIPIPSEALEEERRYKLVKEYKSQMLRVYGMLPPNMAERIEAMSEEKLRRDLEHLRTYPDKLMIGCVHGKTWRCYMCARTCPNNTHIDLVKERLEEHLKEAC